MSDPGWRVTDLDRARHGDAAARLLYQVFLDRTPSWPDLSSARAEVEACLTPGWINRVLVSGDDAVLGWIGGQPHYEGRVWELHPLVVAPAWQGRGLGRALVRDLEALVAARGALTLWAGADDELFETSLGGVDLYQGTGALLDGARGGGQHPLGFYRRLGFALVGVMPDANGPGKPDLYLAKPVSPPTRSSGPEPSPALRR